MPKDREFRLRLADDALIVVTRSSGHPVRYAIMLLVERDSVWYVVRTFDNAHDVQEHHEHGYVGTEKRPPTIVHADVNEAMSAAIVKLREQWADIAREWDGGQPGTCTSTGMREQWADIAREWDSTR